MAERRCDPRVETGKRPPLKERGGFRGLLGTMSKFAFGTETLQERWDGFKAKFQKRTENRENDVRTTEPEQQGGFFERLGRSIDNGIIRTKAFVSKKVEGIKESFSGIGEQFNTEVAGINERRQKLGVVGTVKSYFMDLTDGIKGAGDKIAVRWKEAEIAQMQRERQRLNDRYLTRVQKQGILDRGERLPKNLLTRAELREKLRPIRQAELAARSERRQLMARAEKVRSRIEKNQNVLAVLKAERQEREARRNSRSPAFHAVAA